MSTPDENIGGFSAEDAVAKLSYIFPERFGGDGHEHDIPEPSNEQVAAYFSNLRTFYVEMEAAGRAADKAPEDETDEERDARIMRAIESGKDQSRDGWQRRCELLSALCSGDPSVEQLSKLPYRILNAFEGYMRAAILPNR